MTNNKVAIIVGAGRGMGAECARELKSRGYELALLSPSGAKDLAKDLDALAIAGSVTEPNDLMKVVQLADTKFGRIDAVINSTGHPAQGKILELQDSDWHAGLDLTFLNVVRMARLVTPHFEKQEQGAIVNISTFAAFEPSSTFPVSSAMRAALASFTKLYADEYADKNIRMNNLLPGFIDSYEVDDKIISDIPMHRAGTVKEIAKTAAFLLSDDAGYITGQNIRVDGGLTRSV